MPESSQCDSSFFCNEIINLVSVLTWCRCFFWHIAGFWMVNQSFPEPSVNDASSSRTDTRPAPFLTPRCQMHPHHLALYLNWLHPLPINALQQHRLQLRVGVCILNAASWACNNNTLFSAKDQSSSSTIGDAASAPRQFLLPPPCKRSAVMYRAPSRLPVVPGYHLVLFI